MMIYFFILIFILFGVINFDLLKKRLGRDVYILFCFVSLSLMSAFRYRVGGDSIPYEIYFEELPKLNEIFHYYFDSNILGYQPFWLLINALVKEFGGDVYNFQLLHAIIFNSLLYIYLKDYTQYTLTFILIFFTSLLYFYFAFDIQRESLAIAFFLINIKNLNNNNWKKYYILAFISFMFHISAVVLFIFPLFKLIKVNTKMLITMVLIGLLLTFLKTTFINIFSSFLFLDIMKAKADIYAKSNFSTLGLLSYYFVRVILPLPFIIYLNNIQIKRKSNNGLLFAFVVFSIFAQIIVGFERFLNYFYIWLIVQFINELYSIVFRNVTIIKRFIFKLSFTGMIFFVVFYKVFITDNYGNNYYSIFFPYEHIFTMQKNEEREAYVRNLWGW